MDIQKIMNNPGLWVVCSVMVIVIVVQGILFFRTGSAEAKRLGIPKEKVTKAIRAAVITALGPTLSSAIVLLSLVVVIGGPMAWMRLNDVGAARTEMAVVSMSQAILPENASELTALTFASWGQAINNVGWMIVALLTTSRMGWAVDKMNRKFSPKVVKAVMFGAGVGLFAYLVSNNVIGKKSPYWVASLVAGLSIFVINRYLGKYQRLQEFSLGIAMILGMVAGSCTTGLAA
ncbi:MAG: DUF5058 family protein [Enterocloster asparagiformis]|nr:DUF5058 family protein [Enterocloster asparagiformis]